MEPITVDKIMACESLEDVQALHTGKPMILDKGIPFVTFREFDKVVDHESRNIEYALMNGDGEIYGLNGWDLDLDAATLFSTWKDADTMRDSTQGRSVEIVEVEDGMVIS